MPASIFNGSAVKILKDILRFKLGKEIHSLQVDPTSVAVDAPADSIGFFGESIFIKTDSGLSTNWVEISSTTQTKRLYNLLGTGLLTGGDMSVFSATQVTVNAGTGIITDDSDPDNPTYAEVSWATQQFTVTTTGNAQYIYVDSAGVIQEQPADFTREDSRNKILLGPVNTVGGSVNTAATIVIPQIDTPNLINDLSKAIGIINVTGNIIGDNGANLQVSKTAGTVHELGANYVNNVKDPSTVTTPVLLGPTFSEFYDDGVGGITAIAPANVLDPTIWDDGTGVLNTVNTNNWSVKRVYFGPVSNAIFMTVGRAEYSSFEQATEGFLSESLILPDTPDSLTLLGYIFVRGGATDLSDSGDAFFLQANKFGTGVGGSIPSVDINLQGTYDNSVTGDIVLDDTIGPLALRDNGTTPLSGNLLEVTDNGDTVKYIETDVNRTAIEDRDGRRVLDRSNGIFWEERFKETDPTAFYTTTGGAIIGIETANPISGDRSALMTQSGASATDSWTSDVIQLTGNSDGEEYDRDIIISQSKTNNGADGDYLHKLQQFDGSWTDLSSIESVNGKKLVKHKVNIPSTVTQLRFVDEIVVANDANILKTDTLSVNVEPSDADFISSLDAQVRVNTSSAYGSTNTVIPRFTNIVENYGSAITYTDSATDGASFLINEDGYYNMSFTDTTNSTQYFGISLNSTQLTTPIQNINTDDAIARGIGAIANVPTNCAVGLNLKAGDIIRPHCVGQARGVPAYVNFSIAKPRIAAPEGIDYTTTEKFAGYFFRGKPVYGIVVEGTIASTTVVASGVEHIVEFRGTVETSATEAWAAPFNIGGTYGVVRLNPTTNDVVIFGNASHTYDTILFYTKV